MGMFEKTKDRIRAKRAALYARATAAESGQGTTEYAIIIAVIAVIVVAAMILFQPQLEALWNKAVGAMTSANDLQPGI